MKTPSFLSFFRRDTTPEDLPLSSRVATLEGDVLAMRAHVDSIHTTTRKLQGKVYRGIPLGLTKDENPGEAAAPEEVKPTDSEVLQGRFRSKSDLYKAASYLRGR